MIGWQTALRLGRVSNLPTVWSNVVAGAALAGSALPLAAAGDLVWLAAAISLFYVGGMYLNDAFDREIDARERPSRPIPAGEIAARAAFAIGFGLLAGGIGLLAAFGLAAALWGVALAGAILLYDWHHKGNRASPFLMGACRALVYCSVAAALGTALAPPVLIAALALGCYVAGLSLAAKQELSARPSAIAPFVMLAAPVILIVAGSLATELGWRVGALAWVEPSWSLMLAVVAHLACCGAAFLLLRRRRTGDVGRAIGLLIAGIALVDGVMAAAAGTALGAQICFVLFGLTWFLQRFIAGT